MENSDLNKLNPIISLGSHLIVQRLGFSHHGLYIGRGEILEYTLPHGVSVNYLSNFAAGQEIYIREHKNAKYLGQRAVIRGMSRLGEKKYNLITRNCEHFVNWCIDGVEQSRQVDNIILTIIPFYSIFQESEFIRGCLKVVFNDPCSLDVALEKINANRQAATDPILRAQELSEDILGLKDTKIVKLASFIIKATQKTHEFKELIAKSKQLASLHKSAQQDSTQNDSIHSNANIFKENKTETKQASLKDIASLAPLSFYEQAESLNDTARNSLQEEINSQALQLKQELKHSAVSLLRELKEDGASPHDLKTAFKQGLQNFFNPLTIPRSLLKQDTSLSSQQITESKEHLKDHLKEISACSYFSQSNSLPKDICSTKLSKISSKQEELSLLQSSYCEDIYSMPCDNSHLYHGSNTVYEQTESNNTEEIASTGTSNKTSEFKSNKNTANSNMSSFTKEYTLGSYSLFDLILDVYDNYQQEQEKQEKQQEKQKK